ncbi:hypothetical protein AAULR_16234 [Lacticaseibacillus rhamnosus MTCC 5462]|nr:hypothetical protein AAULR_16234 [Lacticaseibacillus rhamnosus MTCC 5462]
MDDSPVPATDLLQLAAKLMFDLAQLLKTLIAQPVKPIRILFETNSLCSVADFWLIDRINRIHNVIGANQDNERNNGSRR